MDASDLIYFAIIIIGLISGFLKKKKKSANGNEQPKGAIENLLRGFVGQDPEPKNHVEPVYATSQNDPVPTTSKSQHIDDLEHSEKTTSEIIKEHQARFNLKDEKDNSNRTLPEDAIDLKQAIVYDTILNRPKY
ncbi:MAG: hypothetical protein JKY53_08785 [Flavobacteriales bacterium]|nr:hypothetical protein [Flavobacteriales bacterium]